MTDWAAEPRHPRHEVDEILTAPVRLSLIAALARVEDAEFGVVRESLEVSDSVLSKQAAALEAVGYVELRKGYVGKRPRTWLSITPVGRAALARHLAALTAIVDGI
ncbi:MAG: transcriptional regulator [Actinobacteria bacterium]|jgi:DNA-binding MarR family transcriptional regulator|nr:transcriptional regulator [Actinomycetota bacterium]